MGGYGRDRGLKVKFEGSTSRVPSFFEIPEGGERGSANPSFPPMRPTASHLSYPNSREDVVLFQHSGHEG